MRGTEFLAMDSVSIGRASVQNDEERPAMRE